MDIQTWIAKKEQLRAYLVAYGYSADPKLVAAMRDELAGGPEGPACPDTLAALKAQYPTATWPGDTAATVAARLAGPQS